MIPDLRSLAPVIAFLIASLQDPEKAAIKLLEDFENTTRDKTDEIKVFVCKKFKCEDVTTEVRENRLVFVLHGTEETGEEIIEFVFKLLTKFQLIMTEEQITKVKGGILETVFAYYPVDKKLDVEIVVENEKILEKLRGMMKVEEEEVEE